MEKEFITELSKNAFVNHLETNEDALIIKFGAEWCGPCKKIEGLVKNFMNITRPGVKCAVIDVDDNFEIYAYFKSKKMISGIPTIFAYNKGNKTVVPDEVVVGADEFQIRMFFQKYMCTRNDK
jgi:thioredoxin-like negative regulator of GroEL